MAIDFPTLKWVEAFKDKLNSDEGKAWQEAAKDWEGDFLFVIKPDGDFTKKVILHVDLWHGECRKVAYYEEGADLPKTEFQYVGIYSNWIKLIQGEIDPIKGIMMRKFDLVGNKMKVLRAVKAAQELIRTAQKIDTNFL
ncbi:MAG: sterol carrier protein [Asgard group archaeon]|nr:sterol carrier protein [Asgard group archaeon]